MKNTLSTTFSIILVFLFFLPQTGFPQENHNFSRWEKKIRAYEKADSLNMPDKGGIVFTGSSSILRWKTLSQDFPNLPVINRGFGGSQIIDATYYFDRIVSKYQPKQVVLYSGDNDIASGKNPDEVFERFKAFASTMKEKLPGVPLLYLSIKPSISRWDMYGDMEKANKKIRRYASKHKNIKYIDVSTAMLGADGNPRPELFLADDLHMTREGYELWVEIITPYLIR